MGGTKMQEHVSGSRTLPAAPRRRGVRRRLTGLCAAAIIVLGAAGCDTQPLGTSANAAMPGASIDNASYRLGVGDRVQITVFGDQALSGQHDVDAGGSIILPLIGPVKADGLTLGQLEQTIAAKLSRGYVNNPNVTAEIVRYRPFYIVGEVKNPGSYPYVPGMTVINGIALAGGFTYRAREGEFDLTRSEANGRTERLTANQETHVKPGDVITVNERYF